MEVRLLHHSKAQFEILVTELGITVFLQPTIRLLDLVSIIALHFSLLSYIVFPFSTVTEVRSEHPEKARIRISVMVAGIVIELRLLLAKAKLPIVVTELGIKVLLQLAIKVLDFVSIIALQSSLLSKIGLAGLTINLFATNPPL